MIDSIQLIFVALVAGGVGFCGSALLCARVVQDLVNELERREREAHRPPPAFENFPRSQPHQR